MTGDITGNGDVDIRGRFNGSITLESNRVTVAKTGVVTATIKAKNVEVHGQIEGDVLAKELVAIRRDSVVAGDIRAPRVYLEDGSHFKGSIEMPSKSSTNQESNKTPAKAPATKAPEELNLSDVPVERPAGSTQTGS